MEAPLRILHLEDDPNDSALVQSALEAGGINCATTCVQTRDDFVAALDRGNVDLILSDYSLPTFDGFSALELTQKQCPEIPFILVSGTLGEEAAVKAMRSGAADYLLKDRLARLGQAVNQAVEQSWMRKERERAEQAMQQSEHKYRHLFESLSEAAFLIDAKSRRILDANISAEKLLGRTRAEILGMNEAELFPPSEAADYCGKLASGGPRGKGDLDEAEVQLKDGTTVPVRVSLAPIELYGRELVLALMADITERVERKKLEEQFIQAQKMEVVGHLAGGIAHDFNNILSVIMCYSELIVSDPGLDASLQKYGEEIQQASQRAAALTRQLLVFSRKEAVQFVVLDLNNVVNELDKMLRRLVDENIEMIIAPGKQIGHIKADSGYVGQVLMNLVVNARDAMPNGGKITIETKNVILDESYARTHAGVIPGDYVMLSVTDTGIGLTDEVKARLFEAFFTTKPSGKGTGLGLATCQTIVQQSGGHIDVYSEAGQGATFKIYFPRVEQPVEVVAGATQGGPIPRGTETLLVVEDDSAVRQLARHVLEAQGYEVLTASNGQDALHVASERKGSPIRLVITDVVMPLMSGKVMAEWLQTIYPDLEVLFTSGYTDGAITHHGVLEQGIEFLPKPYMPSTLAHKVRAMLDKKKNAPPHDS